MLAFGHEYVYDRNGWIRVFYEPPATPELEEKFMTYGRAAMKVRQIVGDNEMPKVLQNLSPQMWGVIDAFVVFTNGSIRLYLASGHNACPEVEELAKDIDQAIFGQSV